MLQSAAVRVPVSSFSSEDGSSQVRECAEMRLGEPWSQMAFGVACMASKILRRVLQIGHTTSPSMCQGTE